MESNYVFIVSWTGAGVLHNMDQAIGLKRFFPNPEFKEVETYEEACRWAEKRLSDDLKDICTNRLHILSDLDILKIDQITK